MKKMYILSLLLTSVILQGYSQLLSYSHEFPTANTTSFTVTVDATKGNKGLQGQTVSDVYIHTGVLTNKSTSPTNWRYVKYGNVANLFTTVVDSLRATSLGSNKWQYVLGNASVSIRQFYGVPADETITHITILFRSGNGSKKQANSDGSDMYIPVYDEGQFAMKFTAPAMQPTYTVIPEAAPLSVNTIPVTVVTSQQANITLKFNGSTIGTGSSALTASGTATVTTTCDQLIYAEANNGGTTLSDSIQFFRAPASYPTGNRPSGIGDGITYENNGTQALFILYAPNKQKVQLIGDFNNWSQTCSGLMTRETDANGNAWYWTRITGLTPGNQYRFQYIVDDSIRVADPYSELVLDPNNDRYISSSTYPNMPAYPSGKTTGGMVGVITPGEAAYQWNDQSYVRPNKYNLMVYELLIRDFATNKNWQALKDTLGYIAGLGFNAIEVMPFNEFDGNAGWGYNPCYYFAPDKAYGPKNALKDFINEAHKYGIAVIMDVAFNHATGQSPLAALWWNSAQSRPAANNPFFYETAQHPFNVFNDFNHNKAQTRYHVERFIQHWLTEYKLDGFRWDLSKGFTNQNCGNDIGCWNAYNQDRVNIWQNYYNKMQAASAGSYCILEHLSVDQEEYELAARGMLLWGKMTDEFNENTMATSANKDIGRAYWKNRSYWNNSYVDDKPGLITYAESHDEERIMYKNITYSPNTTLRSLNTALARTEAMAAVFMAIPGPKMIWQFGEVGYDFSINRCENGTISTDCRLSNKPLRWDYYYNTANTGRRRLYEVYAAMARLRKQFPDAFNRSTIAAGTWFGNDLWKAVVINHTSVKVVVVANFDASSTTRTQAFPANGTWYDYTNGGSINVSGGSSSLTLSAGAYKVYVNQNVSGGIVTSLFNLFATNSDFKLSVYPNPVQQSATIRYELPKSGQVYYKILNAQGQVVSSKNLGFQLRGVQYLQLNNSTLNSQLLAPGNYILQVSVDNLTHNERFTILK